MTEHKHKLTYGQWAGNPKGDPANLTRCAEEVFVGLIPAQCSRKCGHGPNWVYCKNHAKRFQQEPAP